jgi:hypothetical protein
MLSRNREIGPTPSFPRCGIECNCPTGPPGEEKVCKESKALAGIVMLKLFRQKRSFAECFLVQVEV